MSKKYQVQSANYYRDMNLKKRERVATDARYLYGQMNVDYEERINFGRLRKDRVNKLHSAMAEDGLAAIVLYNTEFVRYATGSKFLTLLHKDHFFRYALVPASGEPFLYEVVGVETEHREMTAPWLQDRIRPSIIWQFSGPAVNKQVTTWAKQLYSDLKDIGIDPRNEKIGFDRIDIPAYEALLSIGIKPVDAWPTMEKVISTKTDDELEILKTVAAIGDAAFDTVKRVVHPGMRENELKGHITNTFYSLGCDEMPGICVASGGHTNPYVRECTDKMIRYGDLLVIDLFPSYLGYHCCHTRTMVVGKATQQQKDLHKLCYEWQWEAMNAIKAGVTTAEIASKFPVHADDQYKTLSMVQFGHGVGITMHEPPTISRGYSMEYPVEIKENAYLAIELYAGMPNGVEGVRIEHNMVVTKNGIEVFTLFPDDLVECLDY